MKSDYIVLALLWAGYCSVHSWLISIGVTRFFQSALVTKYRFYRLFYNVFSLVTLIPLLLYSNSLRFKGPEVFTWAGNWWIVRYSLALLAVVLIIGGARHYSMTQFLGIQQIRKFRVAGAMTQSGDFDSSGVLGLTRHPWYVAVFILIWVGDLWVGTVVINTVLTAYLVVGTILEERKLILEFGDKYREYQRNVSMFIPLEWLSRKRRIKTLSL
jgi:methanethiol S-methyltransferase